MSPSNVTPGHLVNSTLLRDRCFIAGEWRAARNRRAFPVCNPADSRVLGLVPDCTADDVLEAIEAASAVFPDWRDQTAATRGAILQTWANLIYEHQAD